MPTPPPRSSRPSRPPRKRSRPQASARDRQWVPGALRQWRMVHGLNPTEAQVRIGYSARTSAWRDWEAGRYAPSYDVLLKIITATGMIGAGQRAVLEAPPELRSEAALAAHQAAMRRR